MKRLTILVILGLMLVACSSGPPPRPDGPTVGDIPIQPGASEIKTEVPLALRSVSQSHRILLEDTRLGFYRSDEPFVDTVDYYHDELTRLGWGLIDIVEFGDGGFLRRYHLDHKRAIVAFHPGENGTDFMLLQGTIN